VGVGGGRRGRFQWRVGNVAGEALRLGERGWRPGGPCGQAGQLHIKNLDQVVGLVPRQRPAA
jgi:hypothetical protein